MVTICGSRLAEGSDARFQRPLQTPIQASLSGGDSPLAAGDHLWEAALVAVYGISRPGMLLNLPL